MMVFSAALCLFAPASQATAITADGTFHEFVAYDLNQPVIACGSVLCSTTTTFNPTATTFTTPPWTFTGPATLLVLDLFYSGDRFEVFDNNVSLGLTSAAVEGIQCGTPNDGDIGCALADLRFSRGRWVLGAGSHSITMVYNTGTVVGHTGAALQLTAAPEVNSGAAMVMGLAAMFGAARLLRRNGHGRGSQV